MQDSSKKEKVLNDFEQEKRISNTIFLFEKQDSSSKLLIEQINYFGYMVEVFTNMDEMKQSIQERMPLVVLVDLQVDDSDYVQSICDLQNEYNQSLPLFAFSEQESIESRLTAIRCGCKAYFIKPMDVTDLVDAIDSLFITPDNQQYRVLIVDESEIHGKINALHLKKAGISSVVINSPFKLSRAIEDFSPDLLLMDLYMSKCTGVEIARVIRQIKKLVGLPIVFLSYETNKDTQLNAVGYGGDDFLTKPIKPDHFVSSITSRIERYRQMRAIMLRDSLTGLYNHTTISNRLSQEVVRAARQNQSLAIAMIDLDHFKTVNDTYGHSAGDRVLKSLAFLLERRLRRSDVVGRYGGEEFVVILPNTDKNSAKKVINELRESFAQIKHIADKQEFSVTLSAGVAVFPEFRTPTLLADMSDKALYMAKQQGRNRVVVVNNEKDE